MAKAVATSLETMRAKVESAGGSEPVIGFLSASEGKEFSLTASVDLVRKAGPCLHGLVDIEARITRLLEAPDYPIIGGQLLDLWPVPDTDPAAAWKEWHEKAGRPFAC
jgi:hypothetical protein